MQREGSRDEPTNAGHAWVNYDAGLSQGRGDGGRFYVATGDKKWSHDEVYRQNPELEAAVGTADKPTAKIMDCTQGTVGKGRHGEGTNQRMLRYKANRGSRQGIQALELLKALRTQKKEVRGWTRDAAGRLQLKLCHGIHKICIRAPPHRR